MSVKEYKAGMQIEIAAHDLRKETGANQFFSVIHAAFRLADTDNFAILARMFPRTHSELMMLRSSSQYGKMDEDILEVAGLMTKTRALLGIGLKLYEISTEIANATGGNVDEIHAMLSQNYNELVNIYEG